jgi:hypothetical protein
MARGSKKKYTSKHFGHANLARRKLHEHLSAGASACALSLRRPNASVPSVAPPHASRVWTMPALMPSDGSRA